MNDPNACDLFRVEFRPKRQSVPAMQRFRYLLKVALRAFGFEVVRLKVVPDEARQQRQAGPSGA